MKSPTTEPNATTTRINQAGVEKRLTLVPPKRVATKLRRELHTLPPSHPRVRRPSFEKAHERCLNDKHEGDTRLRAPIERMMPDFLGALEKGDGHGVEHADCRDEERDQPERHEDDLYGTEDFVGLADCVGNGVRRKPESEEVIANGRCLFGGCCFYLECLESSGISGGEIVEGEVGNVFFCFRLRRQCEMSSSGRGRLADFFSKRKKQTRVKSLSIISSGDFPNVLANAGSDDDGFGSVERRVPESVLIFFRGAKSCR